MKTCSCGNQHDERTKTCLPCRAKMAVIRQRKIARCPAGLRCCLGCYHYKSVDAFNGLNRTCISCATRQKRLKKMGTNPILAVRRLWMRV